MHVNNEPLSRTIYLLSQNLQKLELNILVPFGITQEQFHLLKVLSKAHKELTQREICQKTLKTPANISRIIDRLERSSLVIRKSSHNDRRVFMVMLTEQGQSLLQEAEVVFNEFSSRLCSEIDMETQSTIERVVKILTSNADLISQDIKGKRTLFGSSKKL